MDQKKKRRQNVACDACKLRRVKCDLSVMLQPPAPADPSVLGSPQPSSSSAPSLADLVRRNPGILNPTRPNKGGRRIDEAKKAFGRDEVNQNHRQETDPLNGRVESSANNSFPRPQSDWAHSLLSTYGVFAPNNDTPPSHNALAFSEVSPLRATQADLDSQNSVLPGFATGTSAPDHNSLLSSYRSSAEPSWYDSSSRSASIPPMWQQPPQYHHSEPLVDHNATREASLPSEPRETGHNDYAQPTTITPFSGTGLISGVGLYPNGLGLFPHSLSGAFDHQARHHTVPLAEHPLPRAPHDSTHISRADQRSSSIERRDLSATQRGLRWGRADGVQESLADTALEVELSRHLIKTFFQAVHYFFPAISPEVFYLEWTRAGQRADAMSPDQEVLCAAIEAWGAQYSDSPIVLGLSSATSAPKVIDSNGTFAPASENRVSWGQARNGACNALLDRLRRLIDRNGIIRKPTIPGVQALTLCIELLFSSGETVKDNEVLMEGILIFDKRQCTDQISRRLFWIQAIIDAFWAVESAANPRIAEDEFESAGQWVISIRKGMPGSSSCKGLSLFVLSQYRTAKAGRRVAIDLAVPNKKGVIGVQDFCRNVRSIWKEFESIIKDLNSQTPGILRKCHKGDLSGFSPLNYFTSVQIAGPFFLFHIHEIIKEQIEYVRKGGVSTDAVIKDPYEEPKPDTSRSKDAQSHLDTLEALQKDSLDNLLKTCRSHVKMLELLLATGILQTASVLLRVLVSLSKLLAETPTNEEGYPSSTPGGRGWTWKVKQREVGICVQALHQAGWAWAEAGQALEDIEKTMKKSAHVIAQLSTTERHDAPSHDDTAAAMGSEEREREEALKAVMKFWPPAPPVNSAFFVESPPSKCSTPAAASRDVTKKAGEDHTGQPSGVIQGDAFFPPLGSDTKSTPWDSTSARPT
ncbi:hypothetical protein I350_04903 [Cryptococcus amylolentus CBS 6273]|uniref:Zn(2)-C6 fungal-type domain-containing protein n=1 Tax=Cryptococcus amylolentus CBS 6273 TaxID=1296118 RepID=A0A1E3K0Y6_9TREE|nr:hypothetical protein I350_04903 [Cryptococcus amylolentus CBS 6273]